MSLSETEKEQLVDKYTAYELVDLLRLGALEVIDSFEVEVEEMIEELLDKSRGIGL